jgi:hypothetical protein
VQLGRTRATASAGHGDETSHCLQSTALTGSHCARIHWGLSLVLLRFVAAGCRCLQQVCVPGASPMVDSTSFRGRVRRLLTDGFLRAEKPPKEGRTEIIDLRCPGLVFRITANGARTWAFRFRDQQSGRQGRAKIGAYPATTLEAARIAATGMRQIVDSGGKRYAGAPCSAVWCRVLWSLGPAISC